jgi:hypothetical protein
MTSASVKILLHSKKMSTRTRAMRVIGVDGALRPYKRAGLSAINGRDQPKD